jgi:hypothetical protein
LPFSDTDEGTQTRKLLKQSELITSAASAVALACICTEHRKGSWMDKPVPVTSGASPARLRLGRCLGGSHRHAPYFQSDESGQNVRGHGFSPKGRTQDNDTCQVGETPPALKGWPKRKRPRCEGPVSSEAGSGERRGLRDQRRDQTAGASVNGSLSPVRNWRQTPATKREAL